MLSGIQRFVTSNLFGTVNTTVI